MWHLVILSAYQPTTENTTMLEVKYYCSMCENTTPADEMDEAWGVKVTDGVAEEVCSGMACPECGASESLKEVIE